MIEKLACNIGRKDEEPNINLAVELCEKGDNTGVKEIVCGLKHKEKAIANDCIKVLYEIGERKPQLISKYTEDFISLLSSKNNRLIWGGMTALATVALINPNSIYDNLTVIKKAYKEGSVITIDNSITVFAKLCKANEKYEKEIFPILMQHLEFCRPKEVPQHAERIMICITDNNKKDFLQVLEKRKVNLTDSQIKRIDKIIKKVI